MKLEANTKLFYMISALLETNHASEATYKMNPIMQTSFMKKNLLAEFPSFIQSWDMKPHVK